MTNLSVHPVMMRLFMTCGIVPKHNRHMYLSLEPPITLTRQYFVADRKREKIWRETKSTLLSHLWNFRNRECTEPIERVYALLGITCDVGKAQLEPDYEISEVQAFTKATQAIISAHGRLDI